MENSGGFTTWQEAFEKQSILSVRIFEKQLQSSILRDKEKLRILVGGNYRELLSTADEIITLNARSKSTETEIADLSLQCKPPEYTGGGNTASPEAEQAAQLWLLSRCILAASGALRSRSILLSAELAVVSRSLLKSVAEFHDAAKAVETLRVKDATIRRQLLRYVDSQLMNPMSSITSIVDAIAAYCLLTSVSSSDAIKHFQNLRLFRLRQRFESDDQNSRQIRESFRYLINSVQTLKALLSRGVNDVLNTLQRQPILENPDIARLDILQIDQARTLISKDVLTFTPYIKRVALQKNDIIQIVRTWAVEASQVAADGLGRALGQISSVNEVLKLRRDLLSIILPVYYSSHSHDALLQSVREATNRRIHERCLVQIEVLLRIGKDMASHKSLAPAAQSAWDESFVERLATSDNRSYLRQVQSRHLGTKGTLDKELKKMRTWSRKFKQLQSQIAEVRLIRWQDLVEEPEDDDEDSAAVLIDQLGKLDPSTYESSVMDALQRTVSAFETLLQDEVSNTLAEDNTSITETMFLLRALRESSASIALAAPSTKLDVANMTLRLQQAMAKTVLQRLSAKFESGEILKNISSFTAEDLPSPLVFSVLREVCTAMVDIGGIDIWSPAATSVLKQKLRNEILSSAQVSHYSQSPFDVCYLKAAFGSPRSSGEDKDTQEKATRYWHRTKLLFGALN